MSRYIKYTADDEEANCGNCDHACDSDMWCMNNCGGANGWNGYVRTERQEEIEV